MKRGAFPTIRAGCGTIAALFALLAVAFFETTAFAQVYHPIAFAAPPVQIVSPPNHAVFCGPLHIPILAYTRPEFRATNVEFYANGSNDLGAGVKLSATTGPTPLPFVSPTGMPPDVLLRLGQYWGYVWSNAPAGQFALTAVAKGPSILLPPGPPVTPGYNYTSAPVSITILPTTNSTNPKDIVSIVATDPIAVAGTNCSWLWPCSTNWTAASAVTLTNWGPKGALFTVYRYGDASRPLTVNYTIGGTASNGVDYVAIPTNITISADSCRGLIPIVPIDNGSTHVVKTVILALAPPTTSSATGETYEIGAPSEAEAVIVYGWPRPLPFALPDGTFHVGASGPDGEWSVIEASADLVNWTCVATNQVFQGSVDFVDPNSTGRPSLFYRVVPLASSP
jgi:hypothetical protein